MKILIYIQSNDNKINPISLEAISAAQELKKNKNAEVYAITFSRAISEKLNTYDINPSEKIMLTGVGGILYPVNSLNKEVFNEKVFLNICATNDDIWNYFMIRKNNFVSRVIPGRLRGHIWQGSQKKQLAQINVLKDGNTVLFKNMINQYGNPFNF